VCWLAADALSLGNSSGREGWGEASGTAECFAPVPCRRSPLALQTIALAPSALAHRCLGRGACVVSPQALWLSPEQLVNVGGPRGHGPNGGSHVCGVEIRSYRSDRLHEHQKDGTPVGWVEAVCGATVAVVNYGAHANGVNDFEKNVKAAAAALEAKCGDAIRGPGRPKVCPVALVPVPCLLDCRHMCPAALQLTPLAGHPLATPSDTHLGPWGAFGARVLAGAR